MAPNKRKILEAARKFAQKGQKDRALKEYEKLLRLDPRDAKLRLEIGDAYRRWGEVDEAITAYTKVAQQYMDEGFDARAVAVFKQIQNLDADRFDSYVPLAELYQRMGLTAEAIQALQTAADGYHREGQKREALELLRKMATLDPTNTTSRIKVGDLLRQEGMGDEAVQEYQAACAELERQGENETAATVLERILEVVPDRIDTMTQLARSLLRQGFGERAEPFAKRALERQPEEVAHFELLADVYGAQERDGELVETYKGLADLYLRRGDEDKAREILQRFVPPDAFSAPADGDSRMGDAELGAGAPPPLEDEFLEEGLDPDKLGVTPTPEAFVEETVLELGEEAEAEPLTDEVPATRELDDAFETDEPPIEGDPDQLLAEASVYLRYGKRAQAVKNLDAILAREPDHRGALEKLGEAHADAGESGAAVDAWLKAAERARAEGDDEAVSVLRDRIAALDEGAAASLGIGPAEPALEEILDLGGEEGRTTQVELDLDEPELDVEDEIEIDLDTEELDAEADAAPPQGPETQAPVDVAGESLAGASASTSQQIAEDAEEAEFYHQQGLLDEAEAIYQRILQEAPNHPLALVRMGEIAAARGDDPGATSSGLKPPPASESAAPDAAAEDAPGQDLAEWTDDGLGEDDFAVGDEASGAPALDATDAPALDATDAADQIDLDDDSEFEVEVADDDLVDLAGDTAADQDVADLAGDTAADQDVADLAGDTAADQDVADLAGDTAADQDVADVAGDSAADHDLADVAGDIAAGDSGEPGEATTGIDVVVEDAAAATDDDELLAIGDEPDADSDELLSEDELLDTSDDPVVVPEEVAASPPEPAAAPAAVQAAQDEVETAPDPNSDSFDLAAELSQALDDDEGASTGSLGTETENDIFASVFSEFKKGVSKQLGEGDQEAHWDLGIAYREMGLLEDAMGEFQAAMTSPTRRVDSLHMLGVCALDLDRAQEAVEHLQAGLDSPDVSDDQSLAVRFELGRALESLGELEKARDAWQAVAAVDPDFCDVEERLETLGQVSVAPDAEATENFESFGDLFDESEASDEASEPPAAEEEHESFEDLMDENDEVVTAEMPVAEPDPEPPKKRRRKKKISFV